MFSGFPAGVAPSGRKRRGRKRTGASHKARVCCRRNRVSHACLTSTPYITWHLRPRAGRRPYMPNAKKTEEKIERMLNAWRALAPDKTFGGMTIAQFEAAAAPSTAARQKIDTLEAQLTEAYAERDRADETFEARAKQVVAGVLADLTEGD